MKMYREKKDRQAFLGPMKGISNKGQLSRELQQ